MARVIIEGSNGPVIGHYKDGRAIVPADSWEEIFDGHVSDEGGTIDFIKPQGPFTLCRITTLDAEGVADFWTPKGTPSVQWNFSKPRQIKEIKLS